MKSICIIGRPNVGKSTLFNKLVGKKISITEDTPGVTRDRIYGNATYQDVTFSVIDTGGIEVSKDLFQDEIRVQVEIGILESDKLLFVVDGKEGLTKDDWMIRDLLRKSGKEVIVVINKSDTAAIKEHFYDFYELGFETIIPVSAEQNMGILDLMDEIIRGFPKNNKEDDTKTKICVIGRPNVGKSSLINALLQEERVIVSDIAGTTRDAVDVDFRYEKEDFVFIDTAGIRKKGKVYEKIEKYSLLRSLRAMERSDICLIVLNREEGIIEQDKHIAGYAKAAGKGVIFVVNKWDTVKEKDQDIKEFSKKIRDQFAFLSYAPIVFLSALTKKRVPTLMPEVKRVRENIQKEIKTSDLNKIILDAAALHPAPSYQGRRLKIYYVHQSGIKPPSFQFHVNQKDLVHFSYYRYLENQIRAHFDFTGTPIELTFKNKNES